MYLIYFYFSPYLTVVECNGCQAEEQPRGSQTSADQEVPHPEVLPEQSTSDFDFNEFFNLEKTMPGLASVSAGARRGWTLHSASASAVCCAADGSASSRPSDADAVNWAPWFDLTQQLLLSKLRETVLVFVVSSLCQCSLVLVLRFSLSLTGVFKAFKHSHICGVTDPYSIYIIQPLFQFFSFSFL